MTLADEIVLHVENEDIQAVIKKVGTLTGTTFLFDPEQVKGKITILPVKNVSPQEALTLLQSALALHGYTFLKKEEGIWIIPTEEVVHSERIIEVVRLKYAKADEVASALAWIATAHGMQIVPYYPTNSLIISGNGEAVEELVDTIGRDILPDEWPYTQ